MSRIKLSARKEPLSEEGDKRGRQRADGAGAGETVRGVVLDLDSAPD